MQTSYFLIFAVFALTPLLVQSSTNSQISRDEQLEALGLKLNQLQVKMNYLEAKNAENEEKMAAQEEKIIRLESKNNIKPDLSKGNFERYINSTKTNHFSSINAQDTSSVDRLSAIVPSSCSELGLIGNTMKGYYLVQGTQTNDLVAVFCNFEQDFQIVIGNVGIQTKIVHFYVTRGNIFSTPNAVIPFQVSFLNEGGAMNLASGMFTAPVNGIYRFDLTAHKHSTSASAVEIALQVNGYTSTSAFTIQPSTGIDDTISVTASMQLTTGDRVNLFLKNAGTVWAISFSGWLEKEYLVGIF